MIFPGDAMIDLSKPLLTPWQLAPKFFAAGVEHIMTGYDHLCFLIAVMLWATRVLAGGEAGDRLHRSRIR